MNHRSPSVRLISTATVTIQALSMLSFFMFAGCNSWKYNVMLAIDAKTYGRQMTWEDIRSSSDNEPYTMRVLDTDERIIPLFRFMHESPNVMPLDETEIHISTPIIIEKKHDVIFLSVLDHGKEITRVRVVIGNLKSVKDGPKAYVIPIKLPEKNGPIPAGSNPPWYRPQPIKSKP